MSDTASNSVIPPQYRDNQLDAYRALIMIYILCVVHATLWLGLGSEPWQSIILIEMPVIFFISGAAMSLQTKRKTFKQTLVNRCRRLVVPYYVYLLFCIPIAAVYIFFYVKDPNLWQANKILRSFLFRETMPLPLFYHIWFILPYLIIFLLFWFEQRIADRVQRTPFMLTLLLLCGLSMLTDYDLLREVAVYNIFFMAGYFYYRKCKPLLMILVIIGSILVIAALQLTHQGSFIPMQDNKFPPNLMFLFFGLASISVLGLIFTYVRIPQNRIIRRWNDHGYTIYLWQNILIFTLGLVIWSIRTLREWPTIRLIIAAALVFISATIVSYITVPIEKHTISILGMLWDKSAKFITDKIFAK